MQDKKIELEELIDSLSADVLEYMSEILPPNTNSDLGEFVLENALEAYRITAKYLEERGEGN